MPASTNGGEWRDWNVRNTVRLEVRMQQVPFGEVMRDEWYMHEEKFWVRGYGDHDPLPSSEEIVWVQIPRGQKTLMAKEAKKGGAAL